jgi:hypothetical protein
MSESGADTEADRLVDSRTASEYLNVQPRTLESWRARGIGPKHIRYSNRCVRYRIGDLQAWIEARVIEGGAA